ncbi:MAG: glycine--tRNA ligase [Nanoarchaeota archaeon]
MFVTKKNINGQDYYYLQKSVREGKQIKSEYIAYLGKDKMQAEIKAAEIKQQKENTSQVESNIIPTRKQITIEELAMFCKRKGFVYPSGEVYGGLSGFYDYGHNGILLKRNFENIWRQYFLGLSDNYFEIEASEIMPENVFIASGHLKNFTDIAAKSKKGHIERADHLLEKYLKKRVDGLGVEELTSLLKEHKAVCSICQSLIDYIGPINMMFPVQLGIGTGTKAYLRPETAQSPYVNFKLEHEITRGKLPLGLALIGRAYRNELSPRNLLLRQRAFTQAELQIFFNPAKINEHEDFENIKKYLLRVVRTNEREKSAQYVSAQELAKEIPKFYVYHMVKVQQFYFEILKFPQEKFRFFQLNDKEKAFYNKYHFDMEAELDTLGWTEIGGVHYRTDHDLKGHQEISKKNLSVTDEETKQKFIPHVLELSFGVDRNFQTLMTFSYSIDEKRQNTILKLHPKLAPIKAAVFPIIKEEQYETIAEHIVKDLKKEFMCVYDRSGSIGKRYARNDEQGTPFCITVDDKSPQDQKVTIRDRDTTQQIRVKIKDIKNVLRKLINEEITFEKAGGKVETRTKENFV